MGQTPTASAFLQRMRDAISFRRGFLSPNRVMQMWSEGKSDSAAFFAPMALSAIEALTPQTPHSRL
jgi:hypothetical protein